jgi:predicted  nucleic acid-binding Zn-ribbon protein
MKKIKCPKCGHEWETKSKLVLVTCPSCQLKVRIKKEEKEEGVKDDGGF